MKSYLKKLIDNLSSPTDRLNQVDHPKVVVKNVTLPDVTNFPVTPAKMSSSREW